MKLQGAQFEIIQQITQIPYDPELVLLEESEESVESE